MAPRTSDRSINTCRSCRRRKIRCDRERPRCNRCNETGAVCIYEDQVPQPPPTYQFVEEKPGQPTTAGPQSGHGTEQPNSVTISAERLRTIESRVETLNNMVTVLQMQNASGQGSSDGRSATNTSSVGIDKQDLSSGNIGHLSRQGGGRMRYVEPTFWAGMAQETTELDNMLTAQSRHLLEAATQSSDDDEEDDSRLEVDTVTTQRRDTAARATFMRMIGEISSTPPASNPHIGPMSASVARYPGLLRQLPSRTRCDQLLNGYIEGYHPLVPLIHVPTFRQRYAEFWRTRNDPAASTTASVSFASLLVAVLYAGSVACPDCVTAGSIRGPTPEEAAAQLHRLSMKALRLSSFPEVPTLDTLRAYLICQSTCMREEEPLTCVSFVGTSLRAATILGLHRDPSHFDGMGVIECEIRRRVWWQLVHIDVLVAIASGLPPMIDLQCWDVRAITELTEDHWEMVTDTQTQGTASKGRISTSGILVAGKFRATMVLRRSLARLLNKDSPTTLDTIAMRSEFKMLTEDLASRIARIPISETHDSLDQPSYEDNAPLRKWARLLLSAFIDQKYCVVCHPLLKASINQLWSELYPQSIEHCQSFVLKCARLASDVDFKNFHWSWPGNHQPLHALVVLLADVIEAPGGYAAERSRQVIDVAFALCEPEGGLVGGRGAANISARRSLSGGGREAWAYLRNMRTQAWQKAGLESEVTWTRERAGEYCSRESEPHSMYGELANPAQRQTETGVGQDLRGPHRQSTIERELESLNSDTMSPPNIDWAYLDAVFEATDQMDFGEAFESEAHT